MGKRSDFKRQERDFYPTPYEAVAPLLSHLPALHKPMYAEPCAGDGALIRHIGSAAECVIAYDIEPQGVAVLCRDALYYRPIKAIRFDMFITNPPWDRKILHPLIVHLSDMAPTWLLFDADWMHTKQSAEFMPRCRKIVSVGRVKWIPDSKVLDLMRRAGLLSEV